MNQLPTTQTTRPNPFIGQLLLTFSCDNNESAVPVTQLSCAFLNTLIVDVNKMNQL